MSREYRVNHQIKANVVSLVLPDGTINEATPLKEALTIAEEKSLDLVEVSVPKNGKPPVCKVIDYGKMMYQQSKRRKANKQTQHIKEIKYGFNISDHDLATKHRKVEEFLSKHYIVKYTLELRGREKHMAQDALDKINTNLEKFAEMSTWKPPYISRGSKRTGVSTVLHPK